MHITKKPISKRGAGRIQRYLADKKHALEENAYALGVRFHGSGETSLKSVRSGGLKREKAREPGGGTFFGDAEIADTTVYSKGKKWSVVHSVPQGYLDGGSKPIQKSYYAGHHEKEALFNIPPERIKTFVKNIKKGPYVKSDPLLSEIERRMEREGKTMGRFFEENPAHLQHKINYYSLILADDAYEKNRGNLRSAAEKRLGKEGKVTFADMRKTAGELGIIPDLRDYVIGSAFLDMKLKRSGKGFKK